METKLDTFIGQLAEDHEQTEKRLRFIEERMMNPPRR